VINPPIQPDEVTFVAPIVPFPEVLVQLPHSNVDLPPVDVVPVNTESYRIAPVSVPFTPVVSVPPLQRAARVVAMTEPSML
jgi:hypothetical protein